MTNYSCLVNQTVTSRYATFATVYSMVAVVGLLLNGLSLWILLKKHGLTSSNTVFMANLALSDLILALSLPLRIYYYASARWPFGAVTCTAAEMLLRINLYTSSVFVTFISVDRLLAVVFPLHSRTLRSTKSSGIACAVAWLLLTAISVLMAKTYIGKYYKYSMECGEELCFEMPIDNDANKMTGLIASLIIFALLMINVASTAMVVRTLKRHCINPDGHNKKRIILIFCVNLFMFAAFFVPIGMVMFLMSRGMIEVKIDTLKWTLCYATLSSCLDPFIYFFSLDAFWKREVEHALES